MQSHSDELHTTSTTVAQDMQLESGVRNLHCTACVRCLDALRCACGEMRAAVVVVRSRCGLAMGGEAGRRVQRV